MVIKVDPSMQTRQGEAAREPEEVNNTFSCPDSESLVVNLSSVTVRHPIRLRPH